MYSNENTVHNVYIALAEFFLQNYCIIQIT